MDKQSLPSPSTLERFKYGLFSYQSPLNSSGLITSKRTDAQSEWKRDCTSFILSYNPFYFCASDDQYENTVRPALKKISFHSFLFQSLFILAAYHGVICIPITRFNSGISISSCRKSQARSLFFRTAMIPLALYSLLWKYYKSNTDFDLLNQRQIAFPYKENHIFLKANYLQEMVTKFVKKKERIQSGIQIPRGPIQGENIVQNTLHFLKTKSKEEEPNLEKNSNFSAATEKSELYELEELLKSDKYFEKSLEQGLKH